MQCIFILAFLQGVQGGVRGPPLYPLNNILGGQAESNPDPSASFVSQRRSLGLSDTSLTH